MPRTVKTSSQAEFVALVPALAGYRPRDSVVCVLFEGRCAHTAFRLDLPGRHRQSDYRVVADAVATIAIRSGVDRVATVLYTEQSYEAQSGIPWRDFAQVLDGRLLRAGLDRVGSFCVAADAWGDYGEPGAPSHPLAELASDYDVPELDAIAALPEPDADTWVELQLALEAIRALPDPNDHIETCLDHDPSLTELADLVALAQSPANRDVMMAQIAFGRIVGEAYARDNAHLHELQRETGLSMDEVVRRELDAGRRDLDDEFVGLLWGAGRIRPDTDRVDRALAWLRIATANVDPALQPPLLCMLSWLSWSLGLGSAAGAYVDAALDIDPDYGMAEVLLEVYRRGLFPEWALPQD